MLKLALHPTTSDGDRDGGGGRKPEIEKTIRHVGARLMTGVNTRGCVKLPLGTSRSRI